MYKHLYDIFKHWYCTDGEHQNAIWLFSDPHWNDKEASLRPDYIGDQALVDSINKKVQKNDTLICLGDVGDLTFVQKLHGYKVLIMGNHDKGASNYMKTERLEKVPVDKYLDGKTPNELFVLFSREEREEIYKKARQKAEAEYKLKKDFIILSNTLIHDFSEPFIFWTAYFTNNLFDEVYEGPLIIGPKIILSHEPIDVCLNINKEPILYNIHGHTHKVLCPRDPYHLDLCVEKHNYEPVCLKHIIEQGVLKTIKDIHRPTIDRAIQNKLLLSSQDK